MNKIRVLVTYLGLVGVPLLVLLVILRAGLHLPATASVGGPWDVDANFSSLADKPCGSLVSSLQRPALNITQSGRELTVILNNSQKTTLAGALSGSKLIAGNPAETMHGTNGQGATPNCGDPQAIHIEAALSGPAGSRTMAGTMSLTGCPDCKPAAFHAAPQTAQQQKAGQQLVPRVVTIIIQIAII